MTTFESNPSIAQFFLYKLGKALSKREEKTSTHTRTWLQTTSRFMLHLLGFGCLTIAGFSWTITAGYIVAGISCFAISWLTTNSDRATPPPDPARR